MFLIVKIKNLEGNFITLLINSKAGNARRQNILYRSKSQF